MRPDGYVAGRGAPGEEARLLDLLARALEAPAVVKLAKELKLDKSSAWRRVRAAIDRSYVKNLEERKGRPAQLVPGDSTTLEQLRGHRNREEFVL